MSAPPGADLREIFLADWGQALHSRGVPAHRLESALEELAAKLEVQAQFLSTPTSLMCAFGPPGSQRVTLARLEPGSTDLGRLTTLDALGQEVLEGRVAVPDALARLSEIKAAPPPYGRLLTVLAFGGSSAAAARLLGGGPAEMGAALGTGLGVGLLSSLASSPAQRRVVAPVGGLLAAVCAAFAAHHGASPTTVTLAGVLVLLPGLSITVAMTELATGNLVSGTSRLAGAVATLLQLAFGVVVGRFLALPLLPATHLLRAHLPEAANGLALAGMVLTLVVLLRARLRDLGWIAVGTGVGWLATRWGASVLDADLAPFAGALAVTIAANLVARLARRPASLVSVPGLLVLVPGSLGLRGMTEMIDDAVAGVALLFQTGFVAVAIVAGILTANVLVPPRRNL